MKSVGILTYQWYDNYGTVLQAYALQTALKKLGYDAHQVPLVLRESTIKRYFAKSLRGTLMKWNKVMMERGNRWRDGFAVFRREFFDYGGLAAMTFSEALRHDFTEDVLVFGSDNIWSFWCYGLDEPMGRLFTGVGINHPHKIVYAASTGGDISTHPQVGEGLARIKSAGFRCISLREPLNINTLARYGIEAVHVPDPTLLLTADDWTAIEDDTLVPDEPYIFGYDLGHPGKISVHEACRQEAAENGLRVMIPYPKRWFRDSNVACYPTPRQWIALVRHAERVVTDSFHGVIFSLSFNRPFRFLEIGGDGEHQSLNLRAREIMKLVGDDSLAKMGTLRDAGLNYLREAVG